MLAGESMRCELGAFASSSICTVCLTEDCRLSLTIRKESLIAVL